MKSLDRFIKRSFRKLVVTLSHAKRVHREEVLLMRSTSISHLPLEILLLIFEILATIDPPIATTTYTPRSKYSSTGLGWIKVTFVCRRWRHAAINTSTLWTRIALRPLGDIWRDTMLFRAGVLPTIIDVCGYMRRNPQRFIEMHLHRVSHLVVGLENTSVLTSLAGRQAPLLQSLVVKFRGASTQRLPATLFTERQHVPDLRRLCLLSLTHNEWDHGILRNIVSLEMIYHERMTDLPSLDAVLDGLQNMAALEQLVLDISHPPLKNEVNPGSIDPSRTRIVDLPSLQCLDFQTRAQRGAELMRSIRLPANAKVRIGVDYWCELCHREEFFAAMNAFLSLQRIPDEREPHFLTRLAIVSTESAHCPYTTVDVQASGKASSFQFTLHYWATTCRIPAITPAALKAIASPELQDLILAEERWEEPAWPTAVKCSTKLRSVEACGAAAIALARLATGTDNTASFLPALASLVLRDINFCWASFQSEPEFVNIGDEFIKLPHWLAARAAAGCPVEDLALKSCAVPEEWVEELRAVVGTTVTWTGGEEDWLGR
ncbi:hypothetical protein FA95DRAFT_1611615 [Auriscalpium vulgare]|uniref:Uncharacterized protein n=1 Tax=Auriscalpium vulgare TaxID=40419 RepID=A0ACB8R916_9AGAM|nr:hypothetical protein FA95DRAFT_1611615 [Auriscalpium vulgare]